MSLNSGIDESHNIGLVLMEEKMNGGDEETTKSYFEGRAEDSSNNIETEKVLAFIDKKINKMSLEHNDFTCNKNSHLEITNTFKYDNSQIKISDTSRENTDFLISEGEEEIFKLESSNISDENFMALNKSSLDENIPILKLHNSVKEINNSIIDLKDWDSNSNISGTTKLNEIVMSDSNPNEEERKSDIKENSICNESNSNSGKHHLNVNENTSDDKDFAIHFNGNLTEDSAPVDGRRISNEINDSSYGRNCSDEFHSYVENMSSKVMNYDSTSLEISNFELDSESFNAESSVFELNNSSEVINPISELENNIPEETSPVSEYNSTIHENHTLLEPDICSSTESNSFFSPLENMNGDESCSLETDDFLMDEKISKLTDSNDEEIKKASFGDKDIGNNSFDCVDEKNKNVFALDDETGKNLSEESKKPEDKSLPEGKEITTNENEVLEGLPLQAQENMNMCICKKIEAKPCEENGSVLLSAWNELRSSLRQLHRSVVPVSLTIPGVSNPRTRPSVNRIKALSNMLLAHDPHQLFTRVYQLSQELCIELKVRLLSTIHDSPNLDQALAFIKGICESYEWVVSVCETIQTAFDKLDTDHLSRFGLNWMTVNMHTFNSIIFTDPDVQDYLASCCLETEEKEEAKEVMGCLASLKRTLAVSENVWAKAENRLHEYAMERAAVNAQRRQLLSGWNHLKTRQSLYDNHSQQCPCTECHKPESKRRCPSPPTISANDKEMPKSCECHFCNSSIAQSQSSANILPSSSMAVLPPLSQPQLSLYPHIHGTSTNGDITSNQGLDDLGPLPSSSATTKPPVFSNPYLGSDLLTEQLIREWDLAYGDALTPPGVQPLTTIAAASVNSTSDLSTQMDSLSVSSNLPYSHTNSDSHSCVHTLQEKLSSTSLVCSNSSNKTINSVSISSSSTKETSSYQKEHLQKMLLQKQEQQRSTSSVITHTKNCTSTAQSHVSRDPAQSDSEMSDPKEWSSGDESDGFSTSSSTANHKDSHCDCCYCHMLQNKPGGGRQRYSDRRERLLKILSNKKRTSSTVTSTNNTCTSTSSSAPSSSASCSNGVKDNQIGRQTLDEILNFIEGTNSKCHKKTAKKARQRERKLAMKRQEEKRKCENRSEDEDEMNNEEYYNDESEENEEDGPLAELRRRAPDVTITVVKPGQKNLNQRPQQKQQPVGMNRDLVTNNQAPLKHHPLASKPVTQPMQQTMSQPNSMWNPPSRPSVPTGRLSSMPISSNSAPTGKMSVASKDSTGTSTGSSSTGGLSSLLKGMENLSKDQGSDKDGKSSQMVTIRRVMDPISSEPTVTITLKGEEPKKDKVLFKLVNGQACPGNNSNSQNAPKSQKAKEKPKQQQQPIYNIPEGTPPEEAKKMKMKLKRERQKLRKKQEFLEEQQREQMKQLEIKKQQEFLRQQEAQIKKQQAALERQHQELLRQQAKAATGQGKKTSKKSKSNELQQKGRKDSKNKGKNISALVYDGDDVARNFSLPPGVSINKVAGQPGMVTISNNMGNQFPQPFLPNPNIYQNGMLPGYPVGSHVSSSGYPISHNGGLGYSGMYGGCGGSSVPWNGGIDPCTGTPQESVIVVDTNSGSSSKTSKSYFKSPDELTSEEKIEAAVNGEIDPSILNKTQKRKYKKCLKSIELGETPIFHATNKQTPKSSTTQSSNNSNKENKQPKNKKNDSSQTVPKKQSKQSQKRVSKKLECMTSEEKIEAAVKGEIDVSYLNQTQKKKYKKCLKAIREEEIIAMQQQKEEDELMDKMYEMAKGRIPKPCQGNNQSKKVANQLGKGKNSKLTSSSHNLSNKKDSVGAKPNQQVVKNDISKTKNDACKTKNDACKTKNDACKTKNDTSKTKNDNSKNKNDACKNKNDGNKTKNDGNKTKNDAKKTKNETNKMKNDTTKVRNDTNKPKNDNNKLKNDASKTKNDIGKTKIDTGKNKNDININKTKIDTNKMRNDTNKMKNDLAKTKNDPIKVKHDTGKMKNDINKTKNDTSKCLNKKNKQGSNGNTNEIGNMQTSSKTKTSSGSSISARKGNEESQPKIESKGQGSKQTQHSQQTQKNPQKNQTNSKQLHQSSNQSTSQKYQSQNSSKSQQQTQKQQIKTNLKSNKQNQLPKQSQDQLTVQKQKKKPNLSLPQQQQQQQHQAFCNQGASHTCQDQQQHHHKNVQKANSVTNMNLNQARLQPGFKGLLRPTDSPLSYSQQLPYDVNSYGPSVGYANNDYGHEARYAQYLAANASTLASVEYENNNMNSQRTIDMPEDGVRHKGKKRGKRGHLEDMTTIDSVFTPKELATGELDDETDREVEAFKRFCLYSVPRNTGQKPKVNFNVKDIMIKKKH